MIQADIRNCNNILSAGIHIKKSHLNILYAMNGSGKSTIASAIDLQSKGQDLNPLQTFGSKAKPECSFSHNLQKVVVFNEEFVKTIVFQQDDIIQNSFDVFIKSPEFEELQASVDKRLAEIRVDISKNGDLQRLIQVGRDIQNRFMVVAE